MANRTKTRSASKKASMKGKRTIKGATGKGVKFEPLGDYAIPTKIQKGLHAMAVEDGAKFNARFINTQLAKLADV